MKELIDKEEINIKLFDTTNKNQREISFLVVESILNDMKKHYLNQVNKEFK